MSSATRLTRGIIEVKLREHRLPENDAQIAFSRLRLGKFLSEETGEHEEAARLSSSAFNILHGHEIAPAERAAEAADQLVEIYTAWQKPNQVEYWKMQSDLLRRGSSDF